jgi:hypothetical protein
MSEKNEWRTLPLLPMTGPLDTRSKPADLTPGAYRAKLNIAVNRSGNLARRTGFKPLDLGPFIGGIVPNWGHHNTPVVLGQPREPLTFLMEATGPNSERFLYDGSKSTLSVLDNQTSEWAYLLAQVGGDGARWRGAVLDDKILFTNNVDLPRAHTMGTTTTSGIPELAGVGVTRAKIAITYMGCVFLMNVVQNTKTITARVWWSDFRDLTKWSLAPAESVAGFQDLEYGDEILNAIELGGALYIFTAQSIYRCVPNPMSDQAFGFQKIYSEPTNRRGCLAYANTLVSDGRSAYWMARDSIYRYAPYLTPVPESPDWLMRASGEIFEPGPNQISPECCEAPIGQYSPDTNEIYFFYPRKATTAVAGDEACINDYGMVASLSAQTADYVDFGMTSMVTFRPGASACGATSVLIGASGHDWCLKQMGVGYSRVYVLFPEGGHPSMDVSPGNYRTETVGYRSLLRGMYPFGYPHRNKILRNVALDHAPEGADTAMLHLRIGNSHTLADPNDTRQTCAVQWHDAGALPVACPDQLPRAAMDQQNLRASDATDWPVYEEGRYLYYDLQIAGPDGGDTLGGETSLHKLEFDFLIRP